MRRLQLLLIVLVTGSFLLYGQSAVTIDNFDSTKPDTVSVHWMSKEANTVFTLTFDGTDKVEGTGSVKAWAKLDSVHPWGTFAQFGYTVPDTATPWDWSGSDSVSLWIKVRTAPSIPGNMVFRISFKDKPSTTDPAEEYIYENASILRSVTSGWVNLKVPLFERHQPGTDIPDSTGFILAPTSWGGFTYNNRTLDRDKISGWSLAIVTTGYVAPLNLPQDSVLVSFDKLERFGVRSFPVILFAGKDWPAYFSSWTWGNSSISVAQNGGTVAGENAIKWIQGDQYGNGWTGWGGDISSPFNMAGAWTKDSLKMMIKADSCGPLRAQFESGANGKIGKVFNVTQDGNWHKYVIALKDMVPQDNTTAFDSSAVKTFGVMAEASGVAGRIVYLTEIWTGTPSLDVIPPPPPANLGAVGATFTNLLTWDAVPNEPGIRYDVYYADHPWTTTADSSVEDIPPYGGTSTLANHVLRAPVTDQNVSYYYGVTSKDLAGNISTPTIMSAPSSNTMAKGVPTIALAPPASFNPNGDISEWTTAGIKPFALSVVSGTAHGVPNYLVTNDADLSVNAYLAVDANNLYVAFDVTDDHVVVDTSAGATDYNQDSPDLFIGLYDWRGKHHDGYTRGATPDYHLRFSKHRVWIDNGGVEVMHRGDAMYAWVEKILTSGYVVEAKIPFALLASKISGGNDVVFVPKDGKRIPIDFAINDRDDAVTQTRHAIMCYSTTTNDNSWSAQYYWTHTWLGTKWVTGVKQTSDVAVKYALEQNYPNPFNPSTQIRYSLAKPGMVSLKVYDVLGREVATLVSGQQTAGSYTATFSSGNDGRSLASGVYFYRLEAGSFVAVHKMMFLK